MAMKTVAVSKLKACLSEYLNQVKASNDVLITDRGKPVAQLVSISRTKTAGESLARMEKQGLIKLGSGKLPKTFWSLPRPQDPKGLVRRALLDERSSGLIRAQENPQGLEIVCLDQNLREAGHKEGFTLIP